MSRTGQRENPQQNAAETCRNQSEPAGWCRQKMTDRFQNGVWWEWLKCQSGMLKEVRTGEGTRPVKVEAGR